MRETKQSFNPTPQAEHIPSVKEDTRATHLAAELRDEVFTGAEHRARHIESDLSGATPLFRNDIDTGSLRLRPGAVHAEESCSKLECNHGLPNIDVSVVDPQTIRPITPGDDYWISNYQSNVSVAAQNGMINDPPKRARFLNMVTQLGGRDVIQVINETAGFFRDTLNSVLGTISSRLGFKSERNAIRDQMRVIEKHILQGGELNVSIEDGNCNVCFSKEGEGAEPSSQIEFPHSQGAINTSNALFMLRRKYMSEENGAEKWNAIADRVHVYALGAGGHIWPEGVEVHSYAHEGDGVPKWTLLASKIAGLWRGTLSGAAQVVEPVVLSNKTDFGDHDIAGYKEDFSRFFVEEYRHSPEALAERLAHTISRGYHPDRLHERIIDQVIDGQETMTVGALFWKREVSSRTSDQVFKSAFADRLLELSSEGKIGNFVLPRQGELQALAESLG